MSASVTEMRISIVMWESIETYSPWTSENCNTREKISDAN
jgi:hypothetical protein